MKFLTLVQKALYQQSLQSFPQARKSASQTHLPTPWLGLLPFNPFAVHSTRDYTWGFLSIFQNGLYKCVEHPKEEMLNVTFKIRVGDLPKTT